jgi:hypothetical protein
MIELIVAAGQKRMARKFLLAVLAAVLLMGIAQTTEWWEQKPYKGRLET